MKFVSPSVHLVAETRLIPEGFQSMLDALGTPQWTTDGHSDTEVLVEAAGKLCYMSFSTDLNKNLTRVGTRNNEEYIQGALIAMKHGSVLEHGCVTIAFMNVSRVFTHELVRHRPGAYSQTSGRYVRSDELSFWVPSIIAEDPDLFKLFQQTVEHQETMAKAMEILSGIDKMTTQADFAKKKILTSAFRRIIGNGVANNIMATYNHRALRHMIEARTSRHAEEEIRLGFNDVFHQLATRYPSIYKDAELTVVDGYDEVVFAHSKV